MKILNLTSHKIFLQVEHNAWLRFPKEQGLKVSCLIYNGKKYIKSFLIKLNLSGMEARTKFGAEYYDEVNGIQLGFYKRAGIYINELEQKFIANHINQDYDLVLVSALTAITHKDAYKELAQALVPYNITFNTIGIISSSFLGPSPTIPSQHLAHAKIYQGPNKVVWPRLINNKVSQVERDVQGRAYFPVTAMTMLPIIKGPKTDALLKKYKLNVEEIEINKPPTSFKPKKGSIISLFLEE